MRVGGALLIVFSCGFIGLIVAKSYSDRVQNIKALLTFVQMLETEIGYSRTSLPEAFERIARQLQGPVSVFLQTVSHRLEVEPDLAMQDAWLFGVYVLEENGLPIAVLEDLITFGDVLGVSDADDQKKHLNLLRVRLTQASETAEAEHRKNARMWQYLGFCAGTLIALLLF
ncbi:MAG: hypothetical protein GX331_09570 [Firmicutes bacterium]|jgi:stage III sporulation protein AB|nr:hypothetical protein [Bacillota bacterium]